jgi:hypothetical protein
LKISDEDKWRDIIGIWVRINGKYYNEIFNRAIGLNLNLAVYLVKYLKRRGSFAEKEAHYGIYALY